MNKNDFLKMFHECVKSGDLKFKAVAIKDTSNGISYETNIYIEIKIDDKELILMPIESWDS